MPYISENGQTRFVTQAEYVAWSKGQGLPTTPLRGGTANGNYNPPAGGTDLNVSRPVDTANLTSKQRRDLVLQQEKQVDQELAGVDSRLAQASTGKITLSPGEIAALEKRKSDLADASNQLADGQPVTSGILDGGRTTEQIIEPNTTVNTPADSLPQAFERSSENNSVSADTNPQVAPTETLVVSASQVQTPANTALTSEDPGFVYNDQGELIPTDSVTAVELVQEQQFAEGLQEPPGTEFDFDGEPLFEPVDVDQSEELGDESVFDNPLEEPEDPDAENVAEYFPSPDDDVFDNPLEEPPGADQDPLALNLDDESDGPRLLNASDSELAEINAGIQAQARQAALQQTVAQQRKTVNNGDWRVKLRLAPQASYLYKSDAPGILKPLQVTDGIIFPYTPSIDTAYKANYSQYDLTHSNYRGYFYQNSYVDVINMRCLFTAQSTSEADYLLATIHFLKSLTKMFYGQDSQAGSPPPVVYLTGLGQYQFNEHPCLLQQFNYTLPADVDYVRAGSNSINNTNLSLRRAKQNNFAGGLLGGFLGSAVDRLLNAGLPKGGITAPPPPNSLSPTNAPTYVPTKMEISINLLPIQSRQQVSKQFSVKQFANGDLLKGGFW
jgi:hypothetical protein